MSSSTGVLLTCTWYTHSLLWAHIFVGLLVLHPLPPRCCLPARLSICRDWFEVSHMSVLCKCIRSHETDDEHFVALCVGQIVEAWCHDGIREARQGLEVLVRSFRSFGLRTASALCEEMKRANQRTGCNRCKKEPTTKITLLSSHEHAVFSS